MKRGFFARPVVDSYPHDPALVFSVATSAKTERAAFAATLKAWKAKHGATIGTPERLIGFEVNLPGKGWIPVDSPAMGRALRDGSFYEA
jgi:hypothetical protein